MIDGRLAVVLFWSSSEEEEQARIVGGAQTHGSGADDDVDVDWMKSIDLVR